MSVKHLLTPILDGGIRNTNFFEGRLLSAADLRDEQSANRERARRLARAIGPGIVEGLEVSLVSDGSDGTPPVLAVESGLAITAGGEVIGLPEGGVQVALARSLESVVTTEADFFACAGPPASSQLPNGVGVYVLVMSPVAGYRERAPKSGLGDAGVVKGCGSRYVQEGVRFRLLVVPGTEGTVTGGGSGSATDSLDALIAGALNGVEFPTRDSPTELALLRNRLAHRLFSTERLIGAYRDPLAEWTARPPDSFAARAYGDSFGALLDSCDVPLALCYWTTNGVEFLDVWAVRRVRNAVPIGANPAIGWRHDDAVAHARMQQFQIQAGELIGAAAAPQNLRARDYFHWLPPLGIVPVHGYGFTTGIDIDLFFDGLTLAIPVFVEGGEVAGMVRDSMLAPPVGFAEDKLIWRYVVRENIQAASAALAADRRQPQMLFATPAMGPYGESRYNAKYWNFGNYR